jgi:YesN/AraC family two-component response regulator
MVAKMIYQSSKTILIIEDDAATRNLFLKALDAEGFQTIGAENGEIGILQTHKYLPDLIMCDLLMPDMDGYSVLNQLRQDKLTAIIPFIFLTASSTSMRKAMELGADDFLKKPATIDEILKAIAIRLEKQSLLKSWYQNQSVSVSEINHTGNNSDVSYPNIPHLKKVFDYIESNYHQGITLSDVAQGIGYSSAYLTNQVSKQTGKGVNAWIVERRMAAARSFLKSTNMNIEEIATKIGYQNPCHFSRQFSRHHNKLSPTMWRKQNQLPNVAENTKQQVIRR